MSLLVQKSKPSKEKQKKSKWIFQFVPEIRSIKDTVLFKIDIFGEIFPILGCHGNQFKPK